MEQDTNYEMDKEQAALEAALARLDDTGVTGLGELLEQFPDIEPDRFPGASASNADGDEVWGDELEALRERVSHALTQPFPLPVESLGELRAQARLTVDDVAEIVSLPTETIDYMEEDVPVIDTPRALLRTIGELYGYATEQVESILRSQGSGGVLGAAYKLREGATALGVVDEAARAPRSFAEILKETGATDEQCRRWLESTDEVPEDTVGDDLFA